MSCRIWGSRNPLEEGLGSAIAPSLSGNSVHGCQAGRLARGHEPKRFGERPCVVLWTSG